MVLSSSSYSYSAVSTSGSLRTTWDGPGSVLRVRFKLKSRLERRPSKAQGLVSSHGVETKNVITVGHNFKNRRGMKLTVDYKLIVG